MTKTSKTGLLFGGDWTEQKLSILADYLRAYNTALKKQPFQRVYVDAFAGTGYREKRQKEFGLRGFFADLEEEAPQQFLKGSAKRALEVQPPFHTYIFVESDADNVRSLERLREEHKDKSAMIEVVQDDANAFVQDFCRQEDWRSTRAVLFLDPFATQVEWATIEAVAATKAIDLWYLFPSMAVNRLLANDPNKACRERLDAVFGAATWFEAFYRTQRLDDIFGEPLDVVRKACDFQALGRFFTNRLKSIFAGVAERPKVLCNSKGSPLFHLFFAAGNPKGAPIAVRIANHLLRKI